MAHYVKVASVADLLPGALRYAEVGDHPIALANVDGVIHAFDDACPHRGASLSAGELDGPVVWCILHGARFDVRTGERLPGYPVRSDLPIHAVRVEGDDVLVEAPDDTGPPSGGPW